MAIAQTACVVPAAVTVAIAIGACGGTAKPHRTAAASAGIKYAACLRANGVPNFPDPTGGGGVNIPNDINPASPAFQAAQQACQSLMPGGSGPGRATADQKRALLNLSRCMRAHGVSGFPDPVSSPPANPAGMAIGFGRPGAFIVIPETLDPSSPRFQQAAKTCHLPGG
jgi:hypothetical protein